MPARAGATAVLPSRPKSPHARRAAATRLNPSHPSFASTWLTPTPPSLPLSFTRAPPSIPGLANLGNTCFLNAAVQSLLHLPPVVALLSTPPHCAPAAPRPTGCALCALQDLLQVDADPFYPRKLALSARAACPGFRPGRQEDAHEFVRGLLEALTRAEVAGCAAAAHPRGPSSSAASKLTTQMERGSSVHAIFSGIFESSVVCWECRHVSTTHEPFLDVSLEINNCQNIQSAFAKFTAVEKLEGNNKYRCSGCKKLVSATKCYVVRIAPNILSLQLKRFDRSRKDNRFVRYPARLDLAPYMRGKPEGVQAVYELSAVLIHQGSSPHYGHYYAYVKTANGSWMLKDDHESRPVAASVALKQKAYMLFYTRVPSAPEKDDLTPPFMPSKSPIYRQPTAGAPAKAQSPPNAAPAKVEQQRRPQKKGIERQQHVQVAWKEQPRFSAQPAAVQNLRSTPVKRTPTPASGQSPGDPPAMKRAPTSGAGLSPGVPAAHRRTLSPAPGVIRHEDDPEHRRVLPQAKPGPRSEVQGKLTKAEADAVAHGAQGRPKADHTEASRKESGRSNASAQDADSKSSLLSGKLSATAAKRKASKLKAMVMRKVSPPNVRQAAGDDDTDATIPSPSQSSPSPSPIVSDSSAGDPPSEGSSASGSVRAILIGGATDAVRKVMRRVFGVSEPPASSKSATSTVTGGQSSASSSGRLSPFRGGGVKWGRRRASRDVPTPEPVTPDVQTISAHRPGSMPRPVRTSQPAGISLHRSGTSTLFSGEGVDVWDTPNIPERQTSEPKGVCTMEADVPRLKKRRRANDDLDEEYDRGKPKKVRQRYANWNGYMRSGAGGGSRGVRARNGFDVAAERRRRGGGRW